MTLEEAKNLVQNEIVYDQYGKKYKVLSIKTWKRKPEKILVSLRYALWCFIKLDENGIHQIYLNNPIER